MAMANELYIFLFPFPSQTKPSRAEAKPANRFINPTYDNRATAKVQFECVCAGVPIYIHTCVYVFTCLCVCLFFATIFQAGKTHVGLNCLLA